MGRHRLEACSKCGAPRSPRSGHHALCEYHLHEKWRLKRYRAWSNAFARLGIEPGKVEKQVMQ
jgi:hypothetical protein